MDTITATITALEVADLVAEGTAYARGIRPTVPRARFTEARAVALMALGAAVNVGRARWQPDGQPSPREPEITFVGPGGWWVALVCEHPGGIPFDDEIPY